MAKVYNCKIGKVKIKITKSLTINVKIQFCFRIDNDVMVYSKKFYDVTEDTEFKKILSYANSPKLGNLDGRIIRCVIDDYNVLIGVGDPIKDEFILFGDPGSEYRCSELINK